MLEGFHCFGGVELVLVGQSMAGKALARSRGIVPAAVPVGTLAPLRRRFGSLGFLGLVGSPFRVGAELSRVPFAVADIADGL